MNDLNCGFLQGRLTRSAESSVMGNGNTLVRLSLAVGGGYYNKQTNAWVDSTSFFDVAYFGERAKKYVEELTKGREVIVEYHLRQNVWEKDGKKNYSVELVADNVRPLRRPGEGKRQSGGVSQNDTANAAGYADPPEDIPF